MSANREVMTSDFIENRADDIDDARKDSFYARTMNVAVDEYGALEKKLEHVTEMLKAVTPPFDVSVDIVNRDSGESVSCTPIMEAVYWAIKRAEYNLSGQGLTRAQTVEYHERYNAGIAWFKTYYPKEYRSLLKGL